MPRRYWKKNEEELLSQLWAGDGLFAREIALIFQRPVKQVYNKAKAMGLRRPGKLRSIAGKIGSQTEAARAHQFASGHTPANKGKKMSPELYAKCAPTMFKKGNTPKNHREVGSERVNKDGYIEVKVAEPNKWRCKHRIIWEEANGPIERGYNVQFKDGNPQNISLENLYLISRAQQLKEQNSLMARYPKELQAVIRLRGAVKRQMTLHNKQKENKDEQ